MSDDAGRPTILYDEIDTVFGPRAKDNEDIRGMLNAGHRKGATAGRCVIRGKAVETEELPAYCAVALAGLDDLPDTIMTRAVVIRMRRRGPGERVRPWRLRTCGAEAEQVALAIKGWTSRVATEVGRRWPDMPPGVEDRDADVWEALLAVADLAGHWPDRARDAAVTLVKASRDRAPTLGVLLLRDLRRVFGTAERITTTALLTALNGIEESPWSTIRRGEPLDARGLSNRLGKYGIKPHLFRDPEPVRGYARADLADAWGRYLPPLDDPEDTAPVSPDERVTSVTAATTGPRRNGVTAVTDKSGPTHTGDGQTTIDDPTRCTVCGEGPMTLADDINAGAHIGCLSLPAPRPLTTTTGRNHR
ncbi:DUF3631 domain-containing protein [Gordonia sp. NPDC003504]